MQIQYDATNYTISTYHMQARVFRPFMFIEHEPQIPKNAQYNIMNISM